MSYVDDLAALLAEHLAREFPRSVEKGRDYGDVDPVMIDADIYGWASRLSDPGQRLNPPDLALLRNAHDELARSLDAFPIEARPYYELVLQIASTALRR